MAAQVHNIRSRNAHKGTANPPRMARVGEACAELEHSVYELKNMAMLAYDTVDAALDIGAAEKVGVGNDGEPTHYRFLLSGQEVDILMFAVGHLQGMALGLYREYFEAIETE